MPRTFNDLDTMDDLFHALDEALRILHELEEDGSDNHELEMAAKQAANLSVELMAAAAIAPPNSGQVQGKLVDGRVVWACK